MTNQLTTLAALPGSGAGCMATLPAEANQVPFQKADGKVQMKAPYFAEPPESPPEGTITEATMEQLGRNLERMRGKGKA